MKKVIVITGGSKGIGRYLAEKFVENGFNVAICARNVKAEQKVFTVKADVSNYADCKKFINQVYKKFKRIDVLINNAGVYGPIGDFTENKIEDWKKAIEINLLGTVYASQLVIPIMKKHKMGKIINLAGAGVGSKKTLPKLTSYFTSKFAVVGFTESLAVELKDKNIQVNAISPGNIYTNLTKHLLSKDKQMKDTEVYQNSLKASQGQGDSLEPVYKLVSFLISKEADHITGRVLSAKWDDLKSLNKKLPENLYKLKRIDRRNFDEI